MCIRDRSEESTDEDEQYEDVQEFFPEEAVPPEAAPELEPEPEPEAVAPASPVRVPSLASEPALATAGVRTPGPEVQQLAGAISGLQRASRRRGMLRYVHAWRTHALAQRHRSDRWEWLQRTASTHAQQLRQRLLRGVLRAWCRLAAKIGAEVAATQAQ